MRRFLCWLVLAGLPNHTMSEAYNQGWADYRSATYLSDDEVLCLIVAAEDQGPIYHDEWLKGWQDATDQDDTLMD